MQTHFWASHQLTTAGGTKEPLHGHNWQVIAEVSGSKLDRTAVLLDFNRLKSILDEITAGFNNTDISRTDFFRNSNPSAEMVAKYIFDTLKPMLPSDIILVSVKVCESPNCWAEFRNK